MRGLVQNARYHYTKCPIVRGTRGALMISLLIQCCQSSYWYPILSFVILILPVILVIGVILKLVILVVVLSPRHGAARNRRMSDSMSQVWYLGTLGKSQVPMQVMSAQVGIPTWRPRPCLLFSLSYYPYFTLYTSISVYNLICTDPASLCWRTNSECRQPGHVSFMQSEFIRQYGMH